jgi:hypothetical protein
LASADPLISMPTFYKGTEETANEPMPSIQAPVFYKGMW